jgi:hypothetical protein
MQAAQGRSDPIPPRKTTRTLSERAFRRLATSVGGGVWLFGRTLLDPVGCLPVAAVIAIHGSGKMGTAACFSLKQHLPPRTGCTRLALARTAVRLGSLEIPGHDHFPPTPLRPSAEMFDCDQNQTVFLASSLGNNGLRSGGAASHSIRVHPRESAAKTSSFLLVN